MLCQFEPSKDTVVDCSFRLSKIMVGDRNFRPLKKKKIIDHMIGEVAQTYDPCK